MQIAPAQTSGLCCVFSDTITPEAKVTKNAVFYSLQNSAAKWARFVLDQIENHERKDFMQEMTDAGYNIKIEAKRLEDIYKNLIENSNVI